MIGMRMWVALLALLAANAAAAECMPVPATDFSSPSAVTEFLRGTADGTDAAWRQKGSPTDEAAGSCALTWIAAWAKRGAWLEELDSAQAEADRAQSLSGAALAYLKVRSIATSEQRETIEPWLIQATDLAAAKIKPGDPRRNWLALALGATAMSVGSDRHWDAARAIADEAALSIGPDGALKDQPFAAHTATLMPLIALATLARAQGEDFYAMNGNGLDRLAGFTAKELSAHPEDKPGAGWSQLYGLHAPASPAAKIPMPRTHPGLGGDVQLLVRSLEPAQE